MEQVNLPDKTKPAVVQDTGHNRINQTFLGTILHDSQFGKRNGHLSNSDTQAPGEKIQKPFSTHSLERKIALALEYARIRPVLPLHWPMEGKCSCDDPYCSSPGKHPLTKNGLHDASQDPVQIRQWLDKWPNANLAIVTGGSLVVIDCDGLQGEESLRKLENKFGKLPPSLEVVTGKGRHLYYCKPSHVHISCNAGKFGANLDIRGEGGYVVAPPSIHITGTAYERKKGPTQVADLPREWLDLLSGKVNTPPPEEQKLPTDNKIPVGQRNSRLFREACKLARLGWSEEMVLAAINAVAQSCCEKPETLGQSEIRALVHSAIKSNPVIMKAPEILSVECIHQRAQEKIPWLVEGIIRPGLGVIGARPSYGKTWWFLNVAKALLAGNPLFGRFSVAPCEILFLGLEEFCGSLSDRIKKIGLPSTGIHFSLDWPSFDDEYFGIDWLEKTLDDNPNIKCVLIDPLARVEPRRRKVTNDYAFVYGWMTPVAQLARTRGIALIFSHHTGKTERKDVQDGLMGTTAYAAVADYKLFLERGAKPEDRIFSVEGRLIPQEIKAVLKLEEGIFSWVGLHHEVRKSELETKVLNALVQPGGGTEIAERLGENKSSVWYCLNRLVQAGLVVREGKAFRLNTLNG